MLADSDRLQRLIFQDHQSVRNVIDGSPSLYPSIASPTRVRFPQRGMTGSTLITTIPLLLDRYVERVTAALHCYTKAVDDQRPARHHPGSAGGWSQISAAERHSRCTVTIDGTRCT